MPDTISQQQKQKQKKYESYVKKVTPAHSLPLNMGKAFLTGGIICTLGQFILNTAKSMGADKEAAGTWCSVILIFLSVLLTGFNLYSKIGKFGGAGGLVPITGLNSRQKARYSALAAKSLPSQGRSFYMAF